MRKMILLLTLSLLLLLAGQGFGETLYVRPSSGEYDTEDGTTYAKAFDGFADIAWGAAAGQVGAGDTLYVCGSHAAQLTVGASGSAGSVITIRGDYTGDAGSIDGTGLTACVYNDGKDYVTITQLTVANAQKGIQCAGVTDSITISYITSSGTNGGTCSDIWFEAGASCTISNCTITQGEDYAICLYTDGASHYVTNSSVTNNTITGSAGKTFSTLVFLYHTDGITCTGNTLTGITNANTASKIINLATVAGGTVSNNTLTNCEGIGFYVGSSTGIVMAGNSVSGQESNAYDFVGSAATVTTCTANACGGVGSFVAEDAAGPVASNVALTSCTASNGTRNPAKEQHGFWTEDSSVMTTDDCTAFSNMGDGFNANNTSSLTCTDCKSYGNGNGAVASSGDGYTAHDTATLNLNRCVAYENFKSGVAVTGASTGYVYNCTFYNNYEASVARNDGIWINSTGNWRIVNNVCAKNETEITITAAAVAGAGTRVIDYNEYGTDSTYWAGGKGFSYDGATKTWAEWLAGNGNQDTHSTNKTAAFWSVTSDDYRPTGGNSWLNIGTTDPDGNGTANTIAGINGVTALPGCVTPGAYQGRLVRDQYMDKMPLPKSFKRWWCPLEVN